MRRAILLALCLSGCAFESWKYKHYPENPFKDIEVVAILPFMNQTAEAKLETEEFANVFASELLKFEGFRVVRPIMILAAAEPGEKIRTADDAIRLARRLKADAIVAAAVTDFHPYHPPRVAVSVQVLRVGAREISEGEIDRITQSASWRRGPFALSRDKAGHLLAAFEKVYDSHQESVRREVVAYAQAQEESDTPFEGEREFLAVQSRYLQFVSNQVIRQILRHAE